MASRSATTLMSMYSDLLAASLDDPVTPDTPPGELLVELLDCRRRLVASSDPTRPPRSAADLAVHLAYDRSLIEFCRARGIDTDPSRFSDLHRERHRLEDELARMGLELEPVDQEGT